MAQLKKIRTPISKRPPKIQVPKTTYKRKLKHKLRSAINDTS